MSGDQTSDNTSHAWLVSPFCVSGNEIVSEVRKV